MKKLLAVILMICMLGGHALAIGDDVVISSEYVTVYRDEDGQLWAIGVYGVENWNEYAVAPTHISVMAMSNTGAPLQEKYYPLYPPVIAPMGVSYAVGIFCFDEEVQKDFASVMLDFYPGSAREEDAPAAYHLLKAESTVQDGKAVTTITNDTGADAETVKVLHLYRNDGNEIVGAHETEVSLKTDETVAVEHTFTFVPYESVETIAFIPAQ